MQEWEKDTIVVFAKNGADQTSQQICPPVLDKNQLKLDYYYMRYLTKHRCTICEKYIPLESQTCPGPDCGKRRIRKNARNSKSKKLRECLIVRY
jgi:predicted RNA-binding Zn-ribbon protein involved in translation (DUF1610 family)